MSDPFDYIRDPAEIYAQSFATVEREAELGRFGVELHTVLKRLIHSCGMIDVIEAFQASEHAITSAKKALKSGAPIYTDVEMVKAGIIERFLPSENELICTLNHDGVREHAEKIGNTRSAAAVDFWTKIDGSIVVIGNAPTALFRLLERIGKGECRPALVIGIPVGFIGAAESKEALSNNDLGVDFITVHGRRGGSAMASAVLNGLASSCHE